MQDERLKKKEEKEKWIKKSKEYNEQVWWKNWEQIKLKKNKDILKKRSKSDDW